MLYSVDNLRDFVRKFLDGEIEPHIKSEPIPEDNTGPVTVSIILGSCVTNAVGQFSVV